MSQHFQIQVFRKSPKLTVANLQQKDKNSNFIMSGYVEVLFYKELALTKITRM